MNIDRWDIAGTFVVCVVFFLAIQIVLWSFSYEEELQEERNQLMFNSTCPEITSEFNNTNYFTDDLIKAWIVNECFK